MWLVNVRRFTKWYSSFRFNHHHYSNKVVKVIGSLMKMNWNWIYNLMCRYFPVSFFYYIYIVYGIHLHWHVIPESKLLQAIHLKIHLQHEVLFVNLNCRSVNRHLTKCARINNAYWTVVLVFSSELKDVWDPNIHSAPKH